MSQTLGEFLYRISKTPVGSGVDIEVLLGLVNDRIEQICRSRPWSRLTNKEAIIQTVAEYATGTVTIDAGSQSGTGDGTTFTSAMTGRLIRFASQLEYYTFTFVDADDFTIDRPLEGDEDLEDVTFRIWQPYYALPSDAGEIHSIRNLTLGIDLEEITREELDRNAAARTNYGDPFVYAPAKDSSSDLAQIELYPGPIDAVGLPIRYRANPPLFTTSTIDTDETFPDWFSVTAVYSGVLADLYRLQDEQQRASAEEMRFNQLVVEMAGEDARRMPPTEFSVSNRYAEHRADRATRSIPRWQSRNWRAAE